MGDESLNQKIQKLLRLAERAGTPEEAETASKMAERLMLKWGIDEAMLRSNLHDGEKPEQIVTLASDRFPKVFVKARTNVAFCVIKGMGNVRAYVINHRDKTATVMVMGFESDVERALMLIQSVVLQADRAQASWWRDNRRSMSHLKASEQFRAKRQFLFSFGAEVRDRLVSMRVEEMTKAEDSTPGTALVVQDRVALVNAEYDKLSLRQGRAVKGGDYGAASAGRAAGRTATLGGTSVGGGSRGQIGR